MSIKKSWQNAKRPKSHAKSWQDAKRPKSHAKSWQEKLHDSKDLPKVVKLKGNARLHWHGETMTVPSPLEVNEIMAKVPKGKLLTIDLLRKKIAKKHKTDIGCPLTCGIFTWIAANAADEVEAAGEKNITPYWRTLKSDGELNPKYPGGVDNQSSRLKSEGFKIINKGKKYLVKDYQNYLVK